MIQFDDAREMERRASLCYGDGLLDIGIGIGLLMLGLGIILGYGAFAAIYMAMLFSIVRSAKRAVTVPRMHHLDFIPEDDADSRLHRGKTVVVISLAVLSALAVLALFMSRVVPATVSATVRANAIVIFGCALAGLFLLIGWGTATKRLRIEAAIALLALVLGYWFDLSVSWYLMLLGAVTVAWGTVALSRFVRDYPRLCIRNGKAYERTY